LSGSHINHTIKKIITIKKVSDQAPTKKKSPTTIQQAFQTVSGALNLGDIEDLSWFLYKGER